MPRWTAITEDHLRAAGHGNIIDSAREQNPGSIDPVAEAIADSTARVRRAVAPGNKLDVDTTKIPGSLKGVTVRLALFGLCELIRFALSDDQKETKRNDVDDLKRIADNKMKVEQPDEETASEQMQPIGHSVEAVNVPARMTGRERTSGL